MLLCIPNFRLLIDSTANDSDSSSNIYMYPVLMFFVSLIQSIFYHQHFDTTYRVGMRIRASIVAAIYKKVRYPWWQTSLVPMQASTFFSAAPMQNVLFWNARDSMTPYKRLIMKSLRFLLIILPPSSAIKPVAHLLHIQEMHPEIHFNVNFPCFFLPLLSRLSFASRTPPNKGQKIELSSIVH